MSSSQETFYIPSYDQFSFAIEVLALPISISFLHGTLCGYLCAGATEQGETYLRALTLQKKDELSRDAALAMFNLYNISQVQLANFDFEFQLLLPDDEEDLMIRAKAFSEWCEGFIQGITMAGVHFDMFDEDEAQDALQHLTDFAELDYQSLAVDEEDERALMEVSEYARMAVLKLHSDIVAQKSEDESKH